jgi:hypothetical protein
MSYKAIMLLTIKELNEFVDSMLLKHKGLKSG